MSRKYNIRWQQSDSEELKKAVKNFNAKISRLEKKNPELKSALPERMSVRQLKKIINTRQDLKRELNSLRRFTQRGSEELVDVPISEYNLKITKWQKNEMSRRKIYINKKRKEALEEYKEIEATSAGKKLGYKVSEVSMGKAEKHKLEPMKIFTKKMSYYDLKKKYRAVLVESQHSYWDTKKIRLLENFKQSILYNFPENEVTDIIEAIENMDFKDFYDKFQAEGGSRAFENSYPGDKTQERQYLNRLRATWVPKEKKKKK